MPVPSFDIPEREAPPGSREAELLQRLDPARLPEHVAVIMDGNGRWAARRHLPRIEGHRRGVRSVREIVENCARLGIKILTIYAFSVENWKRPKSEVETLMAMISEFLSKEVGNLIKNGIRFQPIGRWRDLPARVADDIKQGIAKTSSGKKMLFQVALNYSGRVEIVDACRRIVDDCLSGKLEPGQVDEGSIAERLYNPDVPDPDLLIRTSGEQRISNFLLWELAYTELHITDILWPDFKLVHLLDAISDFQGRERRFGGLNGAEHG